MRAVVFDGKLRVTQDWPAPIPQADQALVRIQRAGICNTDMELVRGMYGFSGVLGHEFVGKVAEGPPQLIGQRVTGEINVACGQCDFCLHDIPSQCRNRTTVGIIGHPGAFADYIALAARNLHVIPDNVSDDEAVFVEPLAAALQVTEAVHISPRDRVIVVGAGKLGMLVAQVLHLTGAHVVVVVRHDKQHSMLHKWGIATAHAGDLEPEKANVVVDCTGTAQGFADAASLVRPRGTIILKSTYHELPTADLTQIVVREIRVIGSRCGPFEAAIRLLASNMVDVRSMIDARYPIGDALQAFAHAGQQGVLKVLLDI